MSCGSPSWTRTNDPAVNSRMLYRLSYKGLLLFSIFILRYNKSDCQVFSRQFSKKLSSKTLNSSLYIMRKSFLFVKFHKFFINSQDVRNASTVFVSITARAPKSSACLRYFAISNPLRNCLGIFKQKNLSVRHSKIHAFGQMSIYHVCADSFCNIKIIF